MIKYPATETIERGALAFPCSRCNASAGQWCVTRTGKRASWFHAARSDPICTVYHAAHFRGRIGQ